MSKITEQVPHYATFRTEPQIIYSQHGVVIATWNATTREITALDGQVVVTGVNDDHTAAIEVRDFFDDPAPISEWALTEYVVSCPHGCNLGDSARRPSQESAFRRIRLHELATSGRLTREDAARENT